MARKAVGSRPGSGGQVRHPEVSARGYPHPCGMAAGLSTAGASRHCTAPGFRLFFQHAPKQRVASFVEFFGGLHIGERAQARAAFQR